MSGFSKFDLIVIGAGPGGYVAAIRAAQLGMSVAVVEKDEVGGTCLNRGCVPTKTFLHTAGLIHEMSKAEDLGIVSSGVKVDVDKLYGRKNQVVSGLRLGVEQLLAANKIELIRGQARVEKVGVISVGDLTLEADKILIACGSSPARLPIPGMDLPDVLTSDQVLADSGKLYERLVIIGGGVIGLEFATVYNSFGCQVSIVEAADRILPFMDREISQNLQMVMRKRGVNFYTSLSLKEIKSENGRLTCHFTKDDAAQALECDGVLVSVGRKANTEGLFAEGLDLGLERGTIPVDENYETAIKGIYAIGDVVKGGIQLAHVASSQGIDAVEVMSGKKRRFSMDAVPSCLYTTPEIACVGLTADDAKRMGIPVMTGKFLMSANGKSLIEMADRGFIKVVFHAKTQIILGAQLMCPRATDMVGELTLAVTDGLTFRQLADVIRAHPTFAEAIGEAVEDAKGEAIHIMPKRK